MSKFPKIRYSLTGLMVAVACCALFFWAWQKWAVRGLIRAIENTSDAPVIVKRGGFTRSYAGRVNTTSTDERLSELDRIGGFSAAVAPLVTLLKDDDKYVRWRSVHALGRIGPDAKQAVPALIETMWHDPEHYVRAASAGALASVDEDTAIKEFVDVLERHNDDTANLFSDIKGHLIEAGPKAVPGLLNLLTKEDFIVRDWGASLLGHIGPDARVAVPALVETMKNDKHSWVRVRAAWAVWRIDGQIGKAAPALVEALQDSNLHARAVAVIAFSEMGPRAKHFVPAVTKILQHEDQFVRESAADALRHIDPELAADAGLETPNLN